MSPRILTGEVAGPPSGGAAGHALGDYLPAAEQYLAGGKRHSPDAVYVLAIDGEPPQTLDLAGVYRRVAIANPRDGHPMGIDVKTVVAQMTCRRDQSLMAPTTLNALHGLVWGAAAGSVMTYKFLNGPQVTLSVLPGAEYKPPPPVWGKVNPPQKARGYRERRYGGAQQRGGRVPDRPPRAKRV